jgi:hypothetical protein
VIDNSAEPRVHVDVSIIPLSMGINIFAGPVLKSALSNRRYATRNVVLKISLSTGRTVDKDIGLTMLQIAYRRLLSAD